MCSGIKQSSKPQRPHLHLSFMVFTEGALLDEGQIATGWRPCQHARTPAAAEVSSGWSGPTFAQKLLQQPTNAHSARISLTDEAACLGEGKGGAGGGRCQHCSPPAAAAGPQDGAASARQPPGRRVWHVFLCWPGDIWQCHLLDAVSLRPHSGSTLNLYKNEHNWLPGVLGLRAFLGKC